MSCLLDVQSVCRFGFRGQESRRQREEQVELFLFEVPVAIFEPVGHQIRREWRSDNFASNLATECGLDNSGIAMERLISPWLRHLYRSQSKFRILEAGCGNRS